MIKSTEAARQQAHDLQNLGSNASDSEGLTSKATGLQDSVEEAQRENPTFRQSLSDSQEAGLKNLTRKLTKSDSAVSKEAKAISKQLEQRTVNPNVSQGGGEWRKAARSAGGASSTSGNHRTGLPRRACSASSPRVQRFFVRARHTTPQLGVLPQIRLPTACLSAAQSCDLQLPVHLAEQLEVRIAGRQRRPDLAYGDANLGPDLEQL